MVEIATAAIKIAESVVSEKVVEGAVKTIETMVKEVGIDSLKETPKEIIEDDLKGLPREINQMEKSIEDLTNDYLKDLKEKADFPQTIPDKPFDSKDLKYRHPEENAKAREEFKANKNRLISEWEKINGQKWPVYEKEVYNKFGEVIRKPGWNHDAHHIKPLSMGGKNEAKNITPLHIEKHNEVHDKGSAYDKLLNELKG